MVWTSIVTHVVVGVVVLSAMNSFFYSILNFIVSLNNSFFITFEIVLNFAFYGETKE